MFFAGNTRGDVKLIYCERNCMSRKLLTAEQLARELKVGVETIDDWGRRHLIPRLKISPKIIRFDRDAVLSALARTTQKPKRPTLLDRGVTNE